MNIEIKSVKIKDSKPEVVYFPLNENGDHQSEITYNKGPKCHDDFERKLETLSIHFALLTGYLRPGGIKTIEEYQDNDGTVQSFKVSAFHIGGKDEDQGVVITGHRILPNGKAQILNSPFYRFNEDDASRYKFMDDLQLALEDCKEEAVKYISGEKVYKDPQLSLELKAEESQEAI